MNIIQLLTDYGWPAIVVTVLTIALTGIIKSPIKKKAIEVANKAGIDKSVFTRWLAFLPLVIAFIGSVLNVGFVQGWGSATADAGSFWGTASTETVLVWGLSVSFYETSDNFLKSLYGKSTNNSSAPADKADQKSADSQVSAKTARLTKKAQKVADELAKAKADDLAKREKAEAVAKVKADAEAKAKAEAEAKAKAEAEAKAKAEAEAKARELASTQALIEQLQVKAQKLSDETSVKILR